MIHDRVLKSSRDDNALPCSTVDLLGISSRNLCDSLNRRQLQPILPASIIVDHILPCLDRKTYENAICLCKDVYETAKVSSAIPPPWPETCLLQRENDIRISCVAFSSSSKAVACGCDDGNVYIRKQSNGQNQKLISPYIHDNGSEVLSIIFSPNDKYLAVGRVDTSIHIWDLGKHFLSKSEAWVLMTQNQRPVHSLSFFPNSKILVSAGHDCFINLWDISSQQYLGPISHPDKVESIAVAPNGKTIVSSTWDGTIRTMEIDSHDIRRILREPVPMNVIGKGLPLTEVQWSVDGEFVYGLKGFRLRQWELKDPTNSSCLSGKRVNRIHSIALAPQAHRVAYAERDGTIRISTLATAYYKADIKRTLFGHIQNCALKFSHDGRTIVSGSNDGTLRLWNVY